MRITIPKPCVCDWLWKQTKALSRATFTNVNLYPIGFTFDESFGHRSLALLPRNMRSKPKRTQIYGSDSWKCDDQGRSVLFCYFARCHGAGHLRLNSIRCGMAVTWTQLRKPQAAGYLCLINLAKKLSPQSFQQAVKHGCRLEARVPPPRFHRNSHLLHGPLTAQPIPLSWTSLTIL